MGNQVKRRVTWLSSKLLLAVGAAVPLLWFSGAPKSVNAQMQTKQGMQMQMAKEGVFEGKGKIVAVVPAKDQVVLDHEEIKGLMGAMTMGYAVRSPELLKGLNSGDAVKFKIDAGEKKIVAIERLP